MEGNDIFYFSCFFFGSEDLLALVIQDICISFSICYVQVIAKFLALMYSYLNISISKNIVPDEIKGRQIHHSFPMTLFQVNH